MFNNFMTFPDHVPQTQPHQAPHIQIPLEQKNPNPDKIDDDLILETQTPHPKISLRTNPSIREWKRNDGQ